MQYVPIIWNTIHYCFQNSLQDEFFPLKMSSSWKGSTYLARAINFLTHYFTSTSTSNKQRCVPERTDRITERNLFADTTTCADWAHLPPFSHLHCAARPLTDFDMVRLDEERCILGDFKPCQQPDHVTRKHSSRMRTDRAATRPRSEPISTRLIVDRHLWKH